MVTYRLAGEACADASARRRKHIRVGSAAASMLPKLAAASTLINLQESDIIRSYLYIPVRTESSVHLDNNDQSPPGTYGPMTDVLTC